MEKPMDRLAVRVPPSTRRRVEAEAEERGETLSEVVRRKLAERQERREEDES